jgi:hypothetical protein
MSCCLFHVGRLTRTSQIELVLGSGPRFFDYSVQQDDLLVENDEKHPRDAIAEGRTDLPKSATKRIDEWLPNRPFPLHRENIGSDQFLVGSRQLLQPVPDRFVSGFGLEEKRAKWTRG